MAARGCTPSIPPLLGKTRQIMVRAAEHRGPRRCFQPLEVFGTLDAMGLASRGNGFADENWSLEMTSSLGTQLSAGLLAFLVSATCILFTIPSLV